MRQLLSILTIFLTLTVTYGQIPDPFDQTKLIVKNKVKSVKIFSCDSTKMSHYISCIYDKKGNPKYSPDSTNNSSCIQYVYDKKGNQIQEIHCKPSQVDTSFYHYDSLGNETLGTWSKGLIAEKYFNTYNRNKQLTKTVWKPMGESREYDRIETVYYYDDKNRLIKNQKIGYLKKTKFKFFDEITSYYYNELGQLRFAVFGVDSLKNSKEYFFYNEMGLLEKDSTYSDGTRCSNKVLIYHYNNDGFLISWNTNETFGDIFETRQQTIDSNGLVKTRRGYSCYDYEYEYFPVKRSVLPSTR